MIRITALFLIALTISPPLAIAQEEAAWDYFSEGLEHYKKGEFFDAIQDFDKAITLSP